MTINNSQHILYKHSQLILISKATAMEFGSEWSIAGRSSRGSVVPHPHPPKHWQNQKEPDEVPQHSRRILEPKTGTRLNSIQERSLIVWNLLQMDSSWFLVLEGSRTGVQTLGLLFFWQTTGLVLQTSLCNVDQVPRNCQHILETPADTCVLV